MPSPVSLATMTSQAIQLSDQTGSNFVAPAEWTVYLNAEASDYYRKLVQADPDRYIQRNPTYLIPLQKGYIQYTGAGTGSGMVAGNAITGASSGATATISAAPDDAVGNTAGTLYITNPVGTFTVGEVINGTGSSTAPTVTQPAQQVGAFQKASGFLPLPTNFWILNRVDYLLTNSPLVFQTLLALNFMEEDNYQFTIPSFYGQGIKYRIQGNFLMFVPQPPIGGNIQLLYTPAYPALVNQSDTLDDLSGFADNIILGAAIRALKKENNFQHAAALQETKNTLDMELSRISQATRDKSTPVQTQSLRNKLNGRWGGYWSW